MSDNPQTVVRDEERNELRRSDRRQTLSQHHRRSSAADARATAYVIEIKARRAEPVKGRVDQSAGRRNAFPSRSHRPFCFAGNKRVSTMIDLRSDTAYSTGKRG